MTSARIRWFCVAAAAAVTLSACSDDDDVATATTITRISTVETTSALTVQSTLPPTAPTTAPTTVTQPPVTTVAPVATTKAATDSAAPAPSTPPGTEPPATDPAEQCDPPDATDTFNDGYPNRMSGMVGSDIRTGAHPCFERVVIEFAGPGDMPGVRVGYVDDPVHLSPSDETVDIDGGATLVISAAAWMPAMEGDGYAGPTDFSPTNVSHIRQVRQIENFEGMTAWAIGLDSERAFDVQLLESPARIVVDIAI